jgi:hypothetical protein
LQLPSVFLLLLLLLYGFVLWLWPLLPCGFVPILVFLFLGLALLFRGPVFVFLRPAFIFLTALLITVI